MLILNKKPLRSYYAAIFAGIYSEEFRNSGYYFMAILSMGSIIDRLLLGCFPGGNSALMLVAERLRVI